MYRRPRAIPALPIALAALSACAAATPGAARGPTPASSATSAAASAAAPLTVPAPAAPTPARPGGDSVIVPDAVAESLLVDIATVDPAIRIEIRYATPYNFTGEALPGYETARGLLRREAAAALGRVQARLRADGLGLKVYDAYRPARAADAMVAWTRRVRREDLLRDGYIAARSRHDLGLAVDLTLVDLATGRELRMGSAFDTFAPTAHTANATGEAAVNRERLRRAMEAEGFENRPEEWWHYSYAVPDPMRFDLVIR